MSKRKTEQAKTLLVRYIRDRRMVAGEQLPSQDVLRKEFRFGTATVSAAIQELKEDGVLEVRDKIGVFVIDPDADGHVGRVIGLAAYSSNLTAYSATLLCFLQMELIRHGCRGEIFYCDHPDDTHRFDIHDSPGLRRCLDQGELHGLVHLDDLSEQSQAFIEERNIPSVFVGNVGYTDNAVYIDDLTVLRRGLARLAAYGCRRPTVLLSDGLRLFAGARMAEVMRAHGFSADGWYHGEAVAGGLAAAERYLAQPEAARPDGFVMFDDVMAGAMTARLALRLAPERRPAGVIVCNATNQCSFPLPRQTRYEIDLQELARLGVELLLKGLTGRAAGPERIWYLPRETRHDDDRAEPVRREAPADAMPVG